MLAFNITMILLSGMCFGSFITMASYRLALTNFFDNISKKDLIFKRSFCPNCNHQLKITQLLPIFSWLLYRGKCGFCSHKISIRYLLIEVTTVVLFLTIFLACGSKIDVRLMIILLMATTLIIMVVVDLEHYFIPDITQIVLAILVVIYHLVITTQHSMSYYLLSSIGFFTFSIVLHYSFLFFTKKQGIGEDDLKFFAVAGLMLGIDQLILFMTISGILGVMFGLLWTRLKKDNSFPFAPVLAVSFLSPVLFKINYIEWLGTLIYLCQKYSAKVVF